MTVVPPAVPSLEPQIARVFPRRTRATPDDDLAFVGDPPPMIVPINAVEVHVSVTFSWDVPEGERLARAWETLGVPVKLGGPACGTRGEEFVPGRYLKPGYVITSRGCPNRCWFCAAWKRDGVTRELPVREGFDVLDDNLLACSRDHVEAVFSMLARQPRRPKFTGGLDAALFQRWHAEAVVSLRPDAVFFAYDDEADWPHVERAISILREAGQSVRGKRVRCYVLCGYLGDTVEAADARCRRVHATGAVPFPMLWQAGQRIDHGKEWRRFARGWCRPAMVSQAGKGKGEGA